MSDPVGSPEARARLRRAMRNALSQYSTLPPLYDAELDSALDALISHLREQPSDVEGLGMERVALPDPNCTNCDGMGCIHCRMRDWFDTDHQEKGCDDYCSMCRPAFTWPTRNEGETDGESPTAADFRALDQSQRHPGS